MEGNSEHAPRMSIELDRVSLNDLDAYLALEKRAENRTYTAAQNREEAEEEFEQGRNL